MRSLAGGNLRAALGKVRTRTVTIALALGASALVFAVAQSPGAETVYLLAGTPTIDFSVSYPSTLYVVGRGQKLEAVRQVCAGLFDIRSDLAGTIYLMEDSQKSISLIHEDDPAKPDVIALSTLGTPDAPAGGGFSFNDASWGVVAGPGIAPSAVLPSPDNPAHEWRVTRILASPSSPARVTQAAGSVYKDFRYNGPGGGPYPYISPGANIDGGARLTVPRFLFGNGPWLLAAFPQGLLAPQAGESQVTVEDASGRRVVTTRGAIVVADTAQVFAFAPDVTYGSRKSVFALWRATGRWSELEGTFIHFVPRTFGAWMSFMLEEPADGRESPGMANERAVSFRNRKSNVPNVRGQFPNDVYMPGGLDLYNLSDDRKIVLKTGQQDSEVLDVSDSGEVFYRVNDEIFSARIEGGTLGPATLIVKGEGVPEVHWIFWSNGKPPA
ncbi:MAG: hypothetical protein ACRD1M_01780 [Terriglobales bacterium]